MDRFLKFVRIMEPRDPDKFQEETETPINLDLPGIDDDPEFETGLDILEQKELLGRTWSPMVIRGGQEGSLLVLPRRFMCLSGDATRHGLALVASNDDGIATASAHRRPAELLKRPHRRGRRGPVRFRR